MQRLFTTFPGGWPGLGLLLLRLGVSLHTLAQGAGYLLSPDMPASRAWPLGAVWIAVGAALFIGFLTPVAATLMALVNGGALASLLPLLPRELQVTRLSLVDLLIMALAVVCLGPGAFSLDALLFGRREIIIHDGSRSSRN